jgi:hypothetical protein
MFAVTESLRRAGVPPIWILAESRVFGISIASMAKLCFFAIAPSQPVCPGCSWSEDLNRR